MAISNFSQLASKAAIDPLSITALVLDDLTARFQGQVPGGEIIDANNVLAVAVEAFASITASAVNSIHERLQGQFPVRANSSRDLFAHLSDYDYLNLFSTPADAKVDLYLDPNYLLEQAELVEGTPLVELRIPAHSTFQIAQYTYGIHYPVLIRGNRNTRTFTVVWDQTTPNPLQMLQQNTLEHLITTWRGQELLLVRIPVQQFQVAEYNEDVTRTGGFMKVYPYSGKFYAARVFVGDGTTWEEVHQTMSEQIYDVDNVTALLDLNLENSILSVAIPRLYFDQDMVGNRVRVQVYTTAGEINLELSTSEANAATAVVPSDHPRSKLFGRMRTFRVLPSNRRIQGGKNGMTFAELKRRVVHGSLVAGKLTTTAELQNYFFDRGFAISRYRDGIDNRTYHCYRQLTTAAGAPLAAGSVPLALVPAEVLADAPSTVKRGIDGSLMIMPTALFRYDPVGHRAVPVSDSERIDIAALDAVDRINLFNNNVFLFSPYHVKLHLDHRFPIAYSYDLSSPSIDLVRFVGENPETTAQLILVASQIEHLERGTGGFRMVLEFLPSDDLVAIAADNPGFFDHLKLGVETRNTLDDPVHVTAVYQGQAGNRLVYHVPLAVDDGDIGYSITKDHALRLVDFRDVHLHGTYDFPLNLDFDLVAMLTADGALVADLPSAAKSHNLNLNFRQVFPTYTQLSVQRLTVTLGRRLAEVNNEALVLTDDLDPQRWPYTVYATYAQDAYARDEQGNLIVTVDGGEVELQLLHAQGDWVFPETVVPVTPVTTTGSPVLTGLAPEVLATLVAGMKVSAPGLPVGTEIHSVEETTVTLSAAVPFTSTSATTEFLIGWPEVLHAEGDPILDAEQHPQYNLALRGLTYLVRANMIDAKLFESQDPRHQNFYREVLDSLTGYYQTVETAKSLMLENTELTFRPLRTFGVAEFQRESAETVEHDLEVELGFKLYLTRSAYRNQTTLASIRTAVLAMVDTQLAAGEISCTKLAAQILHELAPEVEDVDILGINGNVESQTLFVLDPGTAPGLKQRLVLQADQTIGLERGLTLVFVEG